METTNIISSSILLPQTLITVFFTWRINKTLGLKASHRNDERNAVIEFYSKYQQWFFTIIQTNIGMGGIDYLKEIIKNRITMDSFYAESGISQAKVKLLVKDKSIVELTEKINLELYNFHIRWEGDYSSLRFNLEDYHKMFIEKYKKEQNESELEIKENTEERKEIINRMINKREEFKKRILALDNEFTNKVKIYLTH
ncbi:hypothetical protein [Ferruginibacter albus]|uniref:hypothetical protein n=1 Tax=Ferruginibacter albus TaxID=2875540 RepID=UPI001CC37B34|nr:hypothetical protein [Ferruginibacter albus]UAY50824.1 hypothetical protein K9M53_09495 [Ferruginibacter albus]